MDFCDRCPPSRRGQCSTWNISRIQYMVFNLSVIRQSSLAEVWQCGRRGRDQCSTWNIARRAINRRNVPRGTFCEYKRIRVCLLYNRYLIRQILSCAVMPHYAQHTILQRFIICAIRVICGRNYPRLHHTPRSTPGQITLCNCNPSRTSSRSDRIQPANSAGANRSATGLNSTRQRSANRRDKTACRAQS